MLQAADAAGKIKSESQLEALKILLDKGDFVSKEELVQAVDAAVKISFKSRLKALRETTNQCTPKSILEIAQLISDLKESEIGKYIENLEL